MKKRAKSCFKFKEHADVLYRCRYGAERAWIFLCKNCLAFIKKNIKLIPNMVALGNAKRNDEKYCNLFFVCMSADDNRISF